MTVELPDGLPRDGEALYAFGAAPSGVAAQDIEGFPGLHLVTSEGVSLIVETVPLTQWAGPEAQARLEKLETVMPLISRHQEIVAALHERMTVMPLGLACIFSRAEMAKNWLNEKKSQISECLDLIEGHEEWAVKLLTDPARASAAAWKDLLVENPPPEQPGRRYLHEKKLKSELANFLENRTHQMASSFVSSIEKLVTAVKVRPQNASEKPVLSNLAVLVCQNRGSSFAHDIGELQRFLGSEGFEITLTGPWPPYSFSLA